MFRQQRIYNLHTDTPHLNMSKERFIDFYVKEQFEKPHPSIDTSVIAAHIDGMLMYHRVSKIVAPKWLGIGLVREIVIAMNEEAKRDSSLSQDGGFSPR